MSLQERPKGKRLYSMPTTDTIMTLSLHLFSNLDAFLPHLWSFKTWLVDFYPDKLSIDLNILWLPLTRSTARRSTASKPPRRRANSNAGIRSQKRVKSKPTRPRKPRGRRKRRSKSKLLKAQRPRLPHRNPTLPTSRKRKLKPSLSRAFATPMPRT